MMWFREHTFSLLNHDGLDIRVVMVAVEDITVVGLITYCWALLPVTAGYTTQHNRHTSMIHTWSALLHCHCYYILLLKQCSEVNHEWFLLSSSSTLRVSLHLPGHKPVTGSIWSLSGPVPKPTHSTQSLIWSHFPAHIYNHSSNISSTTTFAGFCRTQCGDAENAGPLKMQGWKTASTHAIWSRIFRSRIFHPCDLVPHFPVPRFQSPPQCY